MSSAIIGAGAIGSAFASNGIEASIANSRSPWNSHSRPIGFRRLRR
jgi:predicted dinucleotide-binding enzyme